MSKHKITSKWKLAFGVGILLLLAMTLAAVLIGISLNVTRKTVSCYGGCNTLDNHLAADSGGVTTTVTEGYPWAFKTHMTRDCLSAVPTDCNNTTTNYGNMQRDFVLWVAVSLVSVCGVWLLVKGIWWLVRLVK